MRSGRHPVASARSRHRPMASRELARRNPSPRECRWARLTATTCGAVASSSTRIERRTNGLLSPRSHCVQIGEAAVNQATVCNALGFGLHLGARRDLVVAEHAAVWFLALALVELGFEGFPERGPQAHRTQLGALHARDAGTLPTNAGLSALRDVDVLIGLLHPAQLTARARRHELRLTLRIDTARVDDAAGATRLALRVGRAIGRRRDHLGSSGGGSDGSTWRRSRHRLGWSRAAHDGGRD